MTATQTTRTPAGPVARLSLTLAQVTADRDRLRRIVDRAVQDIESAGYDDADERFPWLEDARAVLAQSDKGE